jgi:hypothetical protein
MDLHSKIAAFLRDKAPETYCDDCLAEATASDVAAVRDETASMRKQPGFLGGGSICTRCGATKSATTKAVN